MPELLLELLSEEIPARMQREAAQRLAAEVDAALAGARAGQGVREAFHGPRRIGVWGEYLAELPAARTEVAGPRLDAPAAALEGFLRKNAATREELAQENGRWILRRTTPAVPTREVIAREFPGLIRRLPWPKSMRWGESAFTWVRPLHRILCVFDGAPVRFALAQGADAAHGLAAGDLTEGHRVMAPGAFAVQDLAGYRETLRERRVVLDAAEREALIESGLARLAAAEGLEVVPDRGLLAEVAGLVEWPVPLLGRIDDAFMDLPPEVMRTTMRVNQRYFALRHPDGRAAARFALVANIEARDGGAAIVAGNERVLRARLADARFFWDQDRKQTLESFLPRLEHVVFYEKLGTQGERVSRLETLAAAIAPMIGADRALATRAARLAKADLASGMVGEFPELQGVMGRYYALHGGEDPRVAEAIAAHYRPLGPGDAVPDEKVAIAVALADKLDQLAGFFAVGERPTGSGDPFALRRAALGVIRIVRENGLRLPIARIFHEFGPIWPAPPPVREVLDFIAERLRVQLRAEGARHDLVAAVFGATPDDDLVRLLARAEALRGLLESPDGANLLAAYRRAANILRIEERKDGPFRPAADPALFAQAEERALAAALDAAEPAARARIAAEDFAGAMAALAALRAPVDAFFDRVTVNDPVPELRRNRLGLLARLRSAMDAVADLSKIEG
ncbi:glycine--tRNA ligase subunit beta [Crenalkalicoccus roseus]|uniref:glycine--tRNA ligase subunit beta n=1 Tax=Crenalkalicoccus roseus TaxID=1485588 RepID=UPI001080720A|nr:glycine--tRNA ligase subunit beta [Crenalkalicoccus roseus]